MALFGKNDKNIRFKEVYSEEFKSKYGGTDLTVIQDTDTGVNYLVRGLKWISTGGISVLLDIVGRISKRDSLG